MEPDYDNMVAHVHRQLGTPNDITLGTYPASTTYGYNQSTGSLDAPTGETINASSTTTDTKTYKTRYNLLQLS